MSEEQVSSEAVVETTAPEAQVVDWKDSISEDYRDVVKEYSSIDDVVKTLQSSQAMIGNSIRIPTEGASKEQFDEFYSKLQSVPGIARLPDQNDPEAVAQFYNSLGRPESADKYQIDLGEGVELDESAVSNFKELAHQIGLTNEQASKLAEFESARYKAYEENLTASRQDSESLLKEKWGNDYQARLTGAKEVINMYKEQYPDAIEDLVNGPAGNNPAFLSMLSELYSSMKETGTITPNQNINYGKTPEQAKMEIQDVMDNGAHPYNNESHPGHKEAVEAMQRLFQSAYPEQ